ncbi:hypothetical protein GGR57DRAFT_518981 [Xylariaceae sp. FL1272]|nr:hypothetical protein GGR57DRAFT_518981 [Xylariaceae sp. FL1272]
MSSPSSESLGVSFKTAMGSPGGAASPIGLASSAGHVTPPIPGSPFNVDDDGALGSSTISSDAEEGIFRLSLDGEEEEAVKTVEREGGIYQDAGTQYEMSAGAAREGLRLGPTRGLPLIISAQQPGAPQLIFEQHHQPDTAHGTGANSQHSSSLIQRSEPIPIPNAIPRRRIPAFNESGLPTIAGYAAPITAEEYRALIQQRRREEVKDHQHQLRQAAITQYYQDRPGPAITKHTTIPLLPQPEQLAASPSDEEIAIKPALFRRKHRNPIKMFGSFLHFNGRGHGRKANEDATKPADAPVLPSADLRNPSYLNLPHAAEYGHTLANKSYEEGLAAGIKTAATAEYQEGYAQGYKDGLDDRKNKMAHPHRAATIPDRRRSIRQPDGTKVGASELVQGVASLIEGLGVARADGMDDEEQDKGKGKGKEALQPRSDEEIVAFLEKVIYHIEKKE